MKLSFTRRDFLAMSIKGVGAAVVSCGLMGCTGSDDKGGFLHGIASGDPTSSSVIIWSRVTPKNDGNVIVSWEVATDAQFTQLVTNGETTTNVDKDYTIKVDAIGLEPNQTYYYRFKCGKKESEIGKTKTLPIGDISQVKLAVMSCSNFPAGYFNVYQMAAETADLDAVVHLGDYIYEYRNGAYAGDNARSLNRESKPANELYTLSDYRIRYAQYRTDSSLNQLHASVPFINVWDDHEVADNTWTDGALNHHEEEGDFYARKEAALQAYFEWLPIRPATPSNFESIYRTFNFGNLVDLHMLDTRIIGRDKQLSYDNYVDWNTKVLDRARFIDDLNNNERRMLGEEQLQWLIDKFSTSNSLWQVLGQQVLMAKTYLPEAIATGQLTIEEYITLNEVNNLADRVKAGDQTLTLEEEAYFQNNKELITENTLIQLKSESVPFNLDAWDGYPREREAILSSAKDNNVNLVVLAGDTHNAWASHLNDADGDIVGVEFATSSVSSPGLEVEIAENNIPLVENRLVGMIDDLSYVNVAERGYMIVTFTKEQVRSKWYYVDTILDRNYSEIVDRGYSMNSELGNPRLQKS